MSLFSSLLIFYPSDPPKITLAEARTFCDQLRNILSLRDILLAVDIKYGESIDQDDETTNLMEWNETGTTGRFVQYPWDHEGRNLPWTELWPGRDAEVRHLYRASIGLGRLPKPVGTELMAMRDEKTSHEFVAPDSLSFQIDPVLPATLNTTELFAYGYIGLSFSGNGFFSWQPLSRYWEQARVSPTLRAVLQLCRETFPVPRLQLGQLSADLGELFLNREEYRQGDWIVSVSETG